MNAVLIDTHATHTHADMEKQSADGGVSLGKVNSAEKHAELDCRANPRLRASLMWQQPFEGNYGTAGAASVGPRCR